MMAFIESARHHKGCPAAWPDFSGCIAAFNEAGGSANQRTNVLASNWRAVSPCQLLGLPPRSGQKMKITLKTSC